ncbi:MFS transporter [Sphingobium xenophagum]|uniref:MFS transporter n=1 Tax=Sphingobium xenophagum TaxID=121428 RepID=UPI001C0D4738|nr:MFS transporter [Sphingobium xenophagum]QWT16213.1 MFS transporter [Sphingobium xenophagum]
MPQTASDRETRTSPANAWYATILLCLLYALSMLDRLILALLAQPVSADLHISDTQLGLLFGLGFGVLYAIAGLPLAHMLDRSHRIRLLCVGVMLWSLATLASAFAPGFTELAFCRAGVAIGEAVLSPAAVSLLADMFPREKRAAPTAVFTAVAAGMSSGAFVLGGWAFQAAGFLSPVYGMAPWRITLILVGAPGLLIALLMFFTVREPVRVRQANTQSYATVSNALAYIRSEARLYGCLFVGIGAYTIVAYTFIAWTPTLLIRKFGLTPSDAGYLFGLIGVTFGLGSTALWPWLVTRWTARGKPERLVTAMGYSLAASAAAMILLGFSHNVSVASAAIALIFLGGTTVSCLPPLIIQYVAPSEMRARLMAGYLVSSNLIGLGIGPALAAAIAENFFSGAGALGSAFACIAIVAGPITLVSLLLAHGAYRTAYLAAAAREFDNAKTLAREDQSVRTDAIPDEPQQVFPAR